MTAPLYTRRIRARHFLGDLAGGFMVVAGVAVFALWLAVLLG